MPYYDVVNLVTVTKTNMIRQNALWLCKNHWCENTAPSLPQSCAAVSGPLELPGRAAQSSHLLLKSPADLRRGFRSSTIWLFYKSNLIASWIHLENCRCFLEHLRLLLESLRALCSAPGESGSIYKYLEVLVKLPRVSGRIACGFWTDLHFADRHCLVQVVVHHQHVYRVNDIVCWIMLDKARCSQSMPNCNERDSKGIEPANMTTLYIHTTTAMLVTQNTDCKTLSEDGQANRWDSEVNLIYIYAVARDSGFALSREQSTLPSCTDHLQYLKMTATVLRFYVLADATIEKLKHQ